MSSLRAVVAIVGRPNVGKSTLFNRIARRKVAIVEDRPGVTRDRNYAEAEHDGKYFLLVDTGGFEPDSPDRLIQQVRDQAQLAVEEADVVMLVVDGVGGPTGIDEEIARALRRSGKPVFLAVNKIDSSRREEEGFLSEYHRFGLSRVFPVSGEHGRGIEDLLTAVIAELPEGSTASTRPPEPDLRDDEDDLDEAPTEEDEEAARAARAAEEANRPVRLAIVGRPNVGKSTLLNALLGKERFVVSPIAGTTRDPIDAELLYKDRRVVLTDTAGIRRQRSISLKVEGYSVLRSLRAAEASDVVVLLLDATEFAVEQDAKIAGLAEEQSKPILVVVNKWDKIEADERKVDAFRDNLNFRLPFLAFAPSLFVSALEGARVTQVLDAALRLYEQASRRASTPLLNNLLEEISAHHGLPVIGGTRARVYYIAQVGVRPPTFVIQTNRPDLVPPEYRRYVANRIRDVFDLQVPIRLIFKRKASLRGRPMKKRGPKKGSGGGGRSKGR